MTVGSIIRTQLARTAPRLEERVVRANWRLRNRDRAYPAAGFPPRLAGVRERLRRNGLVLTDFKTVFDDAALYEAAEEQARRLYTEAPRSTEEARGKTFLTKLASGSFAATDPFARIAIHPNALAVANAYLGLRSTLRSLELWLTEPTPGPAVETQLWHRDADDVMNVKLFLYFTDVTRPAGPLVYAPETHPLGGRRELPEHDERWRSTDEQMERIVPKAEWVLCEGARGSVVFADTCGYHKQLKPEGDQRLLLVAHYVSGTPYVPRVVAIEGADPRALSDDQHVAVFDRTRD